MNDKIEINRAWLKRLQELVEALVEEGDCDGLIRGRINHLAGYVHSLDKHLEETPE